MSLCACIYVTIIKQSVQMALTPSNILENKRSVEVMLNESLNQIFKFGSTSFQHFFSTIDKLLNEC